MTKRKLFFLTIGTLLIVGGFLTWKSFQTKKPAFRTATVERGDIEVKILATGLIQPENRVEIKPAIAGRVERVIVEEGQRVSKGQVLAWMSSTERAALLDAARAKGPEELAHWEDLYKPAPLIAPLSGVIIARNVEAGQTVTSADAVYVLSDRLIVKVDVDETDISKIRLRMPVAFNLDSYPNNDLEGQVLKIAQESKTVNNVNIYTVEVLPKAVPDYMKSGMTANVNFVIDQSTGTLMLPAEAVQHAKRKTTVSLSGPKKSEKGETRDVKTGLTDGKHIEILEGLNEGDTVLIPVLTAGAAQKVNPFGGPSNQRQGGRGAR